MRKVRSYKRSKHFHPLARRRARLGLERIHVAKKLGIGPQTLWRWETLRTTPHALLLKEWKRLLKQAGK